VSSRAEKKVSETLLLKGIEVYIPLVKTMRQWSDRKKMVELPLLKGYVFVRITDSENDLVLQNRAVVGFVKSDGKIAAIRDEEIARLRQLVELGYQLEAFALGRELKAGEKVKIASGALRGIVGVIIEDKDQKQLLVLLESIGQCIRVRVPKDILLYV
jgi:transcription antitermination factor NusG